MTFTIPMWLIWSVGIIVVVIILLLAIFGALVLFELLTTDGNLGWMK